VISVIADTPLFIWVLMAIPPVIAWRRNLPNLIGGAILVGSSFRLLVTLLAEFSVELSPDAENVANWTHLLERATANHLVILFWSFAFVASICFSRKAVSRG
jgi:hypothetical protein